MVAPDLQLTITRDVRTVELDYNPAYYRADLDASIIEELIVRSLSDNDDLQHLRGWTVYDFYPSDDDGLTIELIPPPAARLDAKYRT